ncbi:MAG: DUF2199 domain-containing protein [Polyangiaceae bacterium]
MWTCPICKQQSAELPRCFGASAPWSAFVTDAEFERRVILTPDLCVVDNEHFFVRGQIKIPILGDTEPLVWSVWCSLSEESHRHMTERWETILRDGDSYFGWLASAIPVYADTLHLKTTLHVGAPGKAPLVEIQECEHPLYVDQRNGLSRERLYQIVHQLSHT